MDGSVEKAIAALEKMLDAPELGFRLEAARELLKYDAATRRNRNITYSSE